MEGVESAFGPQGPFLESRDNSFLPIINSSSGPCSCKIVFSPDKLLGLATNRLWIQKTKMRGLDGVKHRVELLSYYCY